MQQSRDIPAASVSFSATLGQPCGPPDMRQRPCIPWESIDVKAGLVAPNLNPGDRQTLD